MQVTVTFRHTRPTEGLRQHAVEKIQRVVKFIRRPIDAHIVLSVDKRRHIAEVVLAANHLKLTAKEETGDLYSAIDLAVAKLERQAKKHAGKFKHRKGGNSAAAQPLERPRRAPARLPRARKVAVRVMPVEDAATELERSGADFLFFENPVNDALSMIYRRRDGEYGLVEPELS